MTHAKIPQCSERLSMAFCNQPDITEDRGPAQRWCVHDMREAYWK